jgi:hypothetical protein
MVDDLNRHQTWPPPLLKKRKFDKNFNKKILKRANCFQTSGKRYICDYLSELWLITLATIKHGRHHLKIEHLTKKCKNYKNKKSCKVPIATKL